jgi:hypothetical protein
MTRDAKPGELREIKLFELIEKMSKRPESRLDLMRYLEKLKGPAEIYVKHLVMSGPSSVRAAAKATGLTSAEIEAALAELEAGFAKLRA